MIAMLAGIVDQQAPDSLVLDVNGVGYLVFASSRTLGRAPARGQPLRLLVETHVREDHIHLYGFVDEAERGWFRLLTTVQGVGARLALAILSVLAPDALTTAIMAQDRAALTRADGVGPKLATRILSELRDKVGGIALGVSDAVPSGRPAAQTPSTAGDAVSALVNLGYSRSDAFGAVAEAARRLGPEPQLDALIRLGLKELGQKELTPKEFGR
jgi:Holliday junction DNA helicase RuvA